MGPIATKVFEYYGWICCKLVSVLTHGVFDTLSLFQRAQRFACEQPLLPGTPLNEDKLESQRERCLCCYDDPGP